MLTLTSLSKRFGGKTAVDGLDLFVPEGTVMGFLGPNGAGKSTTMRMIAGMIEPDAGDVDIAGASVVGNRLEAQARLGYLPEGAPLYLDMVAADFLRFMARARGLSRAAAARAVETAAGDCGIGHVMDARLGTLSKGYRRRVALAGAILHDPPVLVLDEPTDGLDPNQKRVVHALVQRLSATKAILISTHALDEVEAMCTQTVIVNRGRIVDQDTPQGLKDRAPGGDLAALFARITGTFEAVQA